MSENYDFDTEDTVDALRNFANNLINASAKLLNEFGDEEDKGTVIIAMETRKKIRWLIEEYFEDIGGAMMVNHPDRLDEAAKLDKIVNDIAQLLGIELIN